MYAIYRIPSLRVLDFQKVRQKERQEARKLFEGQTEEEIRKKLLEEAERQAVAEEAKEERRKEEKVARLKVVFDVG